MSNREITIARVPAGYTKAGFLAWLTRGESVHVTDTTGQVPMSYVTRRTVTPAMRDEASRRREAYVWAREELTTGALAAVARLTESVATRRMLSAMEARRTRAYRAIPR
jgi:hypothetical protein